MVHPTAFSSYYHGNLPGFSKYVTSFSHILFVALSLYSRSNIYTVLNNAGIKCGTTGIAIGIMLIVCNG